MNTLSTSKQKLSLAFKIIKDTVQGFVDDNVMRLSASWHTLPYFLSFHYFLY